MHHLVQALPQNTSAVDSCVASICAPPKDSCSQLQQPGPFATSGRAAAGLMSPPACMPSCSSALTAEAPASNWASDASTLSR
jgi:hypothetical protein